jgi:hypothetical protein
MEKIKSSFIEERIKFFKEACFWIGLGFSMFFIQSKLKEPLTCESYSVNIEKD